MKVGLTISPGVESEILKLVLFVDEEQANKNLEAAGYSFKIAFSGWPDKDGVFNHTLMTPADYEKMKAANAAFEAQMARERADREKQKSTSEAATS